MKKCSKCKEELSLESFYPNKKARLGVDNVCKECNADRFLRKKYGIGLDAYNQLLEEQNGVCAICKADECKSGRRFCVDHDHQTGHVRGLLCRNCNLAVGYLGDSPEVARQVVKYLT